MTLTGMALKEIYCMAWLARGELMTNGRDIFATGIYQWQNNLTEIRQQIDELSQQKTNAIS